MYSYSSIVGLFGNEGGRYIEVAEDKFHKLLKLILESIHVDEDWYRQTYSDVEEAIQNGQVGSARDHYMEAGFFEDRFPHWIVVDASWYLKNNPDVVDAIKSGKIASAEEHFQRAGFKEGRLPFPGWSLLGRRN